MPAISTYLSEQLLRYAFTAVAMGTRPTGWTVKLHTADPTDAGINEVSGSGYLAQGAAFAFGSGVMANTAPISFPAATSTGYTVTHVSIWDNAGSPNMLVYMPLAVAKAVAVGEAIAFPVSELTIDIV